MNTRESTAPAGTEAAGVNCQRSGNSIPLIAQAQQKRRNGIPCKWERVLRALLTGQSFNRFEAERKLSDHCIHSTAATIQSKGVKVARRTEKVPGFQGIPTEVCRYWIDLADVENTQRAWNLLGGCNMREAA